MTGMRIDNKSSDSSVSPNIQPEQASVKPPNQFAFKSVQIFAHSLFGEILDVTHDIIVQKPYEDGSVRFIEWSGSISTIKCSLVDS